MFGPPKPQLRGRRLTIYLRCLAWGMLLACVTQMVPRMMLLTHNSDAILAPLISKNDLFTTTLKAIGASRFTAAGCIVGLIYTAFAVILSIFVQGKGMFVVVVFDFVMTIVITAAIAVTASYTPLDAGICRSITPKSAEPKTILYASLYEVPESEDGASQCTIALAATYLGFVAAAVYAIITGVTLTRAISGVRNKNKEDSLNVIGYISEPVISVKPKPMGPSVAIPLLATPEPSLCRCSHHHHHCCDTSYHPVDVFQEQATNYVPLSSSVEDESEQPPPYEENDRPKKDRKAPQPSKAQLGSSASSAK